MRRLTSAREVVAVLGGVAEVCKLTRSNPKAVYHWSNTGMFPARALDLMTKALKRKRCTAPARLWNQIEEKRAA